MAYRLDQWHTAYYSKGPVKAARVYTGKVSTKLPRATPPKWAINLSWLQEHGKEALGLRVYREWLAATDTHVIPRARVEDQYMKDVRRTNPLHAIKAIGKLPSVREAFASPPPALPGALDGQDTVAEAPQRSNSSGTNSTVPDSGVRGESAQPSTIPSAGIQRDAARSSTSHGNLTSDQGHKEPVEPVLPMQIDPFSQGSNLTQLTEEDVPAAPLPASPSPDPEPAPAASSSKKSEKGQPKSKAPAPKKPPPKEKASTNGKASASGKARSKEKASSKQQAQPRTASTTGKAKPKGKAREEVAEEVTEEEKGIEGGSDADSSERLVLKLKRNLRGTGKK